MEQEKIKERIVESRILLLNLYCSEMRSITDLEKDALKDGIEAIDEMIKKAN